MVTIIQFSSFAQHSAKRLMVTPSISPPHLYPTQPYEAHLLPSLMDCQMLDKIPPPHFYNLSQTEK